MYIKRSLESTVLELINTHPVVVITGPRQVGKTSLVKQLRDRIPNQAIYLDLEYPDDLNKLQHPTLYLESVATNTVIIDEVQRMPGLFPILRSLVDRNRSPGRFILLGSASPDLIRDTSESLAGRVAYLELMPFTYGEIQQHADLKRHWLRGGFPESLLAQSDQASMQWRQFFVQSYLERDLPMLGLSADPLLIRRLWTMLAHINGEVLNMQMLARSLGISGPSVRRYLDFFEHAFLIRRLLPYAFNKKKRLVKSPRIYLRDTGLLHALLNIGDTTQLLGHPAAGNSWEAYVLHEISSALPTRSELYFYRTQDGTEADVVVVEAGKVSKIIEIKLSTTPSLTKGFHIAGTDLGPVEQFIVCPVEYGYPIGESVRVVGYRELELLFA